MKSTFFGRVICGSWRKPLWIRRKYVTERTYRSECSSPAAAASRRRRQWSSMQMKLVILFTLFYCSSPECSSPAAAASHGRRQRPGHRPGHHGHVHVTEATSSDSTSSKLHRSEYYLASVHMKLIFFTLFLCSSAECSSLAAAASRRRR
jgi:hypothetical protein